MLITGPAGSFNAVAEGAPGVRCSRKLRQKLAVLEITGNVIGVFGEQLLEILYGRCSIILAGTFHCQAITRKNVLWMCDEEFLEYDTA